jgi:hypothetical protein
MTVLVLNCIDKLFSTLEAVQRQSRRVRATSRSNAARQSTSGTIDYAILLPHELQNAPVAAVPTWFSMVDSCQLVVIGNTTSIA